MTCVCRKKDYFYGLGKIILGSWVKSFTYFQWKLS